MAYYPAIYKQETQGGITVDDILTNGQISTTSAYATANYSDISDYTYLFITVKYNYNGTDITLNTATTVEQITISGNALVFRIVTPNIGFLDVRLTKTSVTGRSYGGSWRDIYIDIKGTKDNII